MIRRILRLAGQIIKGLYINEENKLDLNHPHTNSAVDPKFGDKLIKQALIKDKIEGDKGAEGAKEYLKSKGG